jgi:hypothetical protein
MFSPPAPRLLSNTVPESPVPVIYQAGACLDFTADVSSRRHCPRRGVAGACAGRSDATWRHSQLSREPAGLGHWQVPPGPPRARRAASGRRARLRRPAGSGPSRLRLPGVLAATLDSGRGRRTCAQATPLQVVPFLDRPVFFARPRPGRGFACELGHLACPKQARPGQVRAGTLPGRNPGEPARTAPGHSTGRRPRHCHGPRPGPAGPTPARRLSLSGMRLGCYHRPGRACQWQGHWHGTRRSGSPPRGSGLPGRAAQPRAVSAWADGTARLAP